jgi:hypothetical protein
MEDQNPESFSGTINLLKHLANNAGVQVTDGEIADKLDISIEQFNTYFKKEEAPASVFSLLRLHYGDYLKNVIVQNIHMEEFEEDPGPEGEVL